jgi:hypothetical protein
MTDLDGQEMHLIQLFNLYMDANLGWELISWERTHDIIQIKLQKQAMGLIVLGPDHFRSTMDGWIRCKMEKKAHNLPTQYKIQHKYFSNFHISLYPIDESCWGHGYIYI